MATKGFSAIAVTAAAEDIATQIEAGAATFIGCADALIDAWLILPEWVPQLPKRFADSFRREGWWGWDGEADWERRPPHVGHWTLRRVKGGAFEFRISARYFRLFLGGPVDPEAGAVTVAWHRALVRARQDSHYQSMLASIVAGAGAVAPD